MNTRFLSRSFVFFALTFGLLPARAAAHVVKQGETIAGIARAQGGTELRSANQLTGGAGHAGQKLVLPGKKAAPSVKEKPATKSPAGKPGTDASDRPKGSAAKQQPPAAKPAAPKTKPAAPVPAGKKTTVQEKAKRAPAPEVPPPPVKPKAKVEPKPAPTAVPPAAFQAPPALARMLKDLEADDRWRVQIFLDQNGFPPGKVDGLTGEFTAKAAARWMTAAEGRTVQSLLAEAKVAVSGITLRVVIPEGAAEYVGEVPESREAQAKAKSLPYRSLAEFMAERFHTDESTLRRLNPEHDIAALRTGQTITVPAVVPFRIEDRKSSLTPPRSAPAMIMHILHEERMLEVRDAAGTLAAAFPITVGRKPEHIRTGQWKIIFRDRDPEFLFDASMLASGIPGKVRHLLPPGPNNPAGVLWMELEPVTGPEAHIGIHGTDSPDRIGRNQSSGCIRLANWDIVRLARVARDGTFVMWGRPEPKNPGARETSPPEALAATEAP